uniref:Uncharacterized protein n=2 Tax=Pseudomonas syringae TaxID=317 RepID=A0A2P0QEJ7_PSESF|nr:hypothetical protein [Pseudomonas syringae pv. actinidiae]
MKLTIAVVLFLAVAVGLLETGLQTGLHWVSQAGFGFLSISTVLLLADIFVSVISSFRTADSHGA